MEIDNIGNIIVELDKEEECLVDQNVKIKPEKEDVTQKKTLKMK